MAEKKVKFDYRVGAMIEVPRGVLTADEIVQSAEFFSFGTNDLTQTALGITHAVRARRSRPGRKAGAALYWGLILSSATKQRREKLRARLMPPAK